MLARAKAKSLHAGDRDKIADLLAAPGTEDLLLEIPSLRDVARPADLSSGVPLLNPWGQ